MTAHVKPKFSEREALKQLHDIWQEFILYQPRLRATLPADLARAKAQMHAHGGASQSFGEMHWMGFHRLAMIFNARGEALTMSELSEALSCPLSSASRIVDGLVESGFVERRPDPADRRVVRVTLSPQGKQLYESFSQFFDRRLAEFLSHFDDAEREQLVYLMRKSVSILKTMKV